eukprot:jgi/Mesen1/9178/ME000591S08495
MPGIDMVVGGDSSVKKNKKVKVVENAEDVDMVVTPKKGKKEKKTDADATNGAGTESEKKVKKRKAGEDEPEATSPAKKKKSKAVASDENGDADTDSAKKKKKKKTAEAKEDEEEEAPAPVEPVNPMAVSNFRISEPVKKKLKEKGIECLFPIQAQTFDMVMDGSDIVGRARTGQGKTLAFVLPILERLVEVSGIGAGGRRAYGRAPSVIVLTPTRELAKQVATDFEHLGGALGLATLCVYGGAPMPPQESALRRGVDIVVGTPGRIKDHLERGTLNLKTLQYRVLDEADEMLNMGFVDDVETILDLGALPEEGPQDRGPGGRGEDEGEREREAPAAAVPLDAARPGAVSDPEKVQTLLFSATLPGWVKDISERFLKKGRKTVDLVGEEKMKASASVKHLLLPCHWTQRGQVVTDLVSCYGNDGRVIVFTETKHDATEVTQSLAHLSARALHGDIPQSQREVTLAGFRSGKFMVLVATDVAARGLDINDVQLVIQVHLARPPRLRSSLWLTSFGRLARLSCDVATSKREEGGSKPEDEGEGRRTAVTIEIAQSLPELQARPDSSRRLVSYYQAVLQHGSVLEDMAEDTEVAEEEGVDMAEGEGRLIWRLQG